MKCAVHANSCLAWLVFAPPRYPPCTPRCRPQPSWGPRLVTWQHPTIHIIPFLGKYNDEFQKIKVNQSSTVEQIYDIWHDKKSGNKYCRSLPAEWSFRVHGLSMTWLDNIWFQGQTCSIVIGDSPTPLPSKEVPKALLYNCHGIVVEYIKSLASDTLGPWPQTGNWHHHNPGALSQENRVVDDFDGP